MVGHQGIEANPAKVDAIRKMAKPSNKKDVMKLVDGVFWYTKHVHYTLVWICLWN
jgi:hypothetical protein